MKKVGLPNCGTLADFGRTDNLDMGAGGKYDPYKGVAELMSFAKDVSAKTRAFDSSGNDVEIDYLRMMKIVVDSGYRGYVGIEFWPLPAQPWPEIDGILAAKRLLESVRDKLTAG